MFVVTMSGCLINLLNVRSIYITDSITGQSMVLAEFDFEQNSILFIGESVNCSKYLSKLFELMQNKNITINF